MLLCAHNLSGLCFFPSHQVQIYLAWKNKPKQNFSLINMLEFFTVKYILQNSKRSLKLHQFLLTFWAIYVCTFLTLSFPTTAGTLSNTLVHCTVGLFITLQSASYSLIVFDCTCLQVFNLPPLVVLHSPKDQNLSLQLKLIFVHDW